MLVCVRRAVVIYVIGMPHWWFASFPYITTMFNGNRAVLDRQRAMDRISFHLRANFLDFGFQHRFLCDHREENLSRSAQKLPLRQRRVSNPSEHQRVASQVCDWRLLRESLFQKFPNRFFLYFRLFIVMGVTWILEIFMWTCQNSIFYHISKIINFLHIVIILSLLKWEPKIEQLHSAANRLIKFHQLTLLIWDIYRNLRNMRRTISVINWIMSVRNHSTSTRSIAFTTQVSIKHPETECDSILDESNRKEKINSMRLRLNSKDFA